MSKLLTAVFTCKDSVCQMLISEVRFLFSDLCILWFFIRLREKRIDHVNLLVIKSYKIADNNFSVVRLLVFFYWIRR